MLQIDGVIRASGGGRKTYRHASLLASVASLIKPPLSNKGGTKNKRQYTLLSGKRCIYKAKPLLTGC